MIISRTPYRVSFGGGGTDLPAFYRREVGAVLSVAIDKYMYVTVSRRFDPTTRVSYTRTEIADRVDQLEHSIIREGLRLTGLGRHLEITTIGDVPAGTGMGSSSSLAVGILNALHWYNGFAKTPRELAEEACRIELDILRKPIGRQDQYAAAFGGLNYFRFNGDDTVTVEPVEPRPDVLARLEEYCLLVYTEKQRDADGILRRQSEGTKAQMDVLRRMRQLADDMRVVLSTSGDVDHFAELLHQGWELKSSLGFGITNGRIARWYDVARRSGALGGKLLGAGGGGFLLLLVPPDRREVVREALGRPRELDVRFEPQGSRVVFDDKGKGAPVSDPRGQRTSTRREIKDRCESW